MAHISTIADLEQTAAEALQAEKTGYVDLQEVSREVVSTVSEPIAEVEEEEEVSEDEEVR